MERETGSIHYAKYQASERLQRFLALMLDGKQRTTMEIIRGADICAISSAACELRENGFRMECVKRTSPSIYQLFDIEAARALSKQMLSERESYHPNLDGPAEPVGLLMGTDTEVADAVRV